MIPVLYESNETAFTNNGIGRLSDCISCEVTEERNGEFEVEFRYPITGIHYDDITEGRIIFVDHDEQGDAQPFIIYRRSAPINGVVTFNAHHVSYLLSSVIIEPFTASSVADAFNTFTTDNMNTNPFTFWTDNSTGGTMKSEVPASVRSLLGGNQGSILDVFGGEYEFDKFLVRNYAHRGSDKGVTIRYGKNLTNIVWELDTMDLYGSVVPFWSDGESTVVYGSIVSGSAATERVTTLDLSSEFDEQPTVADLESRAASFLASNTPWIPKENIKINFVPLWQTEEYADVAPLERVCLCDTVSVYYTDLGVQATAKVIKVVWDALIEKYTTIELGQAQSSFADTIIGTASDMITRATTGLANEGSVRESLLQLRTDLESQIDGKIQTWYQSSDPSSAWTTTAEKDDHVGDLWYYTGSTTSTLTRHATYRYGSDYTWSEMDVSVDVFDAIDGKTTIYYGSPTGTYTNVNRNDYLVDPTTNKTYRWDGSAWAIVTDWTSTMNAAITNATERITGGLGGHIVFLYDADGKPTDMLVMDTDDVNTAVNVLRINVNGIGFSSTGVSGTYTSAWTLDGAFVADFITSGYLSANRIQGGTLTLGGANNGNGVIVVYNASGTEIGRWDKDGLTATGSLTIKDDYTEFFVGSVQAITYGRVEGITVDTVRGPISKSYISNALTAMKTWTARGGGITSECTTTKQGTYCRIAAVGINDINNVSSSSWNGGITEVVSDGYYELSLRPAYSSSNRTMTMLMTPTSVLMGHTSGVYMRATSSTIGMSNQTQTFSVTSSAVTIQATSSIRLQYTSNNWTINGANQSGNIAVQGSSSKRYKHDITDQIDDELDAHRLYDLTMKQFVYNDDCEKWQYGDMKGQTLPGFIAEEVEEIYPSAAIHNESGQVESWDERRIIPGMLKLIQEQHDEIEDLKERLARMEKIVESLIL